MKEHIADEVLNEGDIDPAGPFVDKRPGFSF